MMPYSICLSLTYFMYHNALQVHSCCCKWQKFIFYGWVVFQPVHSEDQPRDFFGRNDAKAETPVLWPPHVKSWLIGKDCDAGSDWGQEEKGKTEDEMAGWHHWLNGRDSGWTPGVGDGRGGLACCDSWGRKESDTTERLHSLTRSWMWDVAFVLVFWVSFACLIWICLLTDPFSPLDICFWD